jgi:hypothetical protein
MDSIASSFAASYSDSLVKKNKTAIEALKNLKKNKFKNAETAKDSVNINQTK